MIYWEKKAWPCSAQIDRYNLNMGQLHILEIKLDDKLETHVLRNWLSHHQIGSKPYYIDLTTRSQLEQEEILGKIQRLGEELLLNYFFPYTCYIIVGKRLSKKHWHLPLIEGLADLPSFYLKNRTSRKKEIGLSTKINTYSEKLSSLRLDLRLKDLHLKLKHQDQLYLACYQLGHIERIEAKKKKRKNHERQ